MRSFIGLTAGETINHLYPYSPRVQGQSHTYIDAVVRAGGTPLIIPAVDDEAALRQLYDRCGGILFSGGNDVDPSLYGEEPREHTIDFSPQRDRQELQLLTWALADDKPVLAICRGMQLLNVSLGGTLYQHVPDDLPGSEVHDILHEKRRESRIVHQLRLEPGSRLASVLDVHELGTNAYHHQAVKKLGEGLEATAWSSDDVVEAIELPGHRFVIGVQSHPESLEAKIEPRWQKLFTALVDAAS